MNILVRMVPRCPLESVAEFGGANEKERKEQRGGRERGGRKEGRERGGGGGERERIMHVNNAQKRNSRIVITAGMLFTF